MNLPGFDVQVCESLSDGQAIVPPSGVAMSCGRCAPCLERAKRIGLSRPEDRVRVATNWHRGTVEVSKGGKVLGEIQAVPLDAMSRQRIGEDGNWRQNSDHMDAVGESVRQIIAALGHIAPELTVLT